MPADAWEFLLARMSDLRALHGAISVLSWDQETYMPPKGVAARGDALATLQALAHEKLTAPELDDALAGAEDALGRGGAERGGDPAAGASIPPDAAAMLRVLRRDRDRAAAIPVALVRELAQRQAHALAAWREARERDAFAAFAPHLEKLLAVRRDMADALLQTLPDGGGERYDALLEGYEPGMRVSRLEPLLGGMASWLAPLVARLVDRPLPPDAFRGVRLDDEGQWQLTLELLAAMGFDRDAGRQDRSAHPFTVGVDPGDVRVTTRVIPELPLSAIFSTIHEAGHGLYEQGLPAEHRRDVLGAAASMGLHESQSRLWENMVGRSLPFWRFLYPRMQSRFPALAAVPMAAAHRAATRVERSPIRVEADEVTYNLHIALRFHLELALLRGDLAVADLPAAWNHESERLLALRPRRDAEGVLQDIHWAWGEFGYFPTYAIGNLYAAALFAALRRERSGVDEEIANGSLLGIRDWLRERVHRHGRVLTAEEIVRRATGQGLQDADLRMYLESKYARDPA